MAEALSSDSVSPAAEVRLAITRMPPGLRRAAPNDLTIRRRRSGPGFYYIAPDGKVVRDATTLRRLKSLAVPPAYQEVLYAEDPKAHLQAVGRDAAGRLQYRYHPEWEKVRERRKARRLVALVQALPQIRRSVTRHLAAGEPTREFVLAAIIELVARSAIRPGSETYARAHGTRGAATLLKSNVNIKRDTIILTFRAKGGQAVHREIRSRRLAAAIGILQQLPGRRLFQYRDETGAAHLVRRRDVNEFLHLTASVRISLKDFRTLMASTFVLETLAHLSPEKSQRLRRRQILEAVRAAAEELSNTPTVCRKSYVHDTIFAAFENGGLRRFSAKLKLCRSAGGREQVLAQIVRSAFT
ncbi:MAG: topoisomerase [Alphaproteobacteria bacterium]|jgi:DNA topoisomerase-1|nr:topoisomerase [Alphaproteobacteria bacterium]